jgi:hypothetical protein
MFRFLLEHQPLQSMLFSLVVIFMHYANVIEVDAITQFYFTIPTKIDNATGVTFSVDTDNKLFSWVDNGTSIVAVNSTPNVQADDTNLDLDANEYLLAIDDNIQEGTRVYMCIGLPNFKDPICETDAIDNNNLAVASFDIPFW